MTNMREKPKNLSPLSIEWKNIVQHESRAVRSGKPHFAVIEGEVLTITLHQTQTRVAQLR